MAHRQEIIFRAQKLRKQGFSVPAIATRLGVSKSTAFRWTQDVKLSQEEMQNLVRNSRYGREKGLARISEVRELQEKLRKLEATNTVDSTLKELDQRWCQIIAALIFWCEGSKRSLSQGVRFANSDPALVKVFLGALRRGFVNINESKFRALLHLHEYHDRETQMKFWSDITSIPSSRFYRPYLKPHTGLRRRVDYQGCISIRYADASLARRLQALYHAFEKIWGRGEVVS